MSTTTAQTPATIVNHEEVAEQKRGPWGDLGVNIYKVDIQLQLMAQSSLKKLADNFPKTIDDVIKAEAILKEVKAEGKSIQEQRLQITRPVDKRLAELTVPEKSFIQPVADFEKAIITLKRADEERQRAERQKNEEIAKCKEFLISTKNNADALFKQKINEKLEKVYKYALGDGGVTMATLPDFIDLAISRMTEADFKIPYPLNPYNTEYVPAELFIKMCNELLIIDSKPYLAQYENAVRAKFVDYEVALSNKELALKQAEDDAKQAAANIESEKMNANTAAKLQSMASTMAVVSTGTKGLKKVYEVDMPDTMESMIAIMAAYIAHIDLTSQKNTGVNKWLSFTPAQAAISLAKVKNDDPNFQPALITFKTTDKL